MGLLGSIVRGVVGVVTALAVLGGIAYWADYGIDASVTKKEMMGSSCEVTVKTKYLGITHTVTDLDNQSCFAVQEGNAVTYHVRTKHTTLYDSDGGRCVYDSVTGPGCASMVA